jgi:hypothetical protein
MSAMKDQFLDIEEKIVEAIKAGKTSFEEVFDYVNANLTVDRSEVFDVMAVSRVVFLTLSRAV